MLPLAGRRILITRSRHQASELAAKLEALGAATILLPTIELIPPASFDPLDTAIANLHSFDWLVFTSANAVEAFQQRITKSPLPDPIYPRIAAIGPATAQAAAQIGLTISLVPETAVAESLTAALLQKLTPSSRVLLVRAAVARDHLPTSLQAAGIHVTIADAYQTRIPPASLSAVEQIFSAPDRLPHAVTFASSSSVTNLIALLQTAGITLPPSIVRASIGPVTTQTLCAHGFPPQVQASQPSIPSLTDALVDYFLQPTPEQARP